MMLPVRRPCSTIPKWQRTRVNVSGGLRLCPVVDTSTFDDCFRSEYASVVRVVAPIVGSVAEAEGITQDAFVKAFVRWSRIGGYDRPGAWVQRVAIRDAVRAAARATRSSGDLDERTLGSTPGADELAVGLDPALVRAIRSLPPQQRACVVLHHLDDRPVAEVAETLGCREATVRVHLHRARAALAASLDPREVSDGSR